MSARERYLPKRSAPTDGADEAADLRVGRRAIALLQAARDAGDPSLIAQAEALALTAGLALARRLREEREAGAGA